MSRSFALAAAVATVLTLGVSMPAAAAPPLAPPPVDSADRLHDADRRQAPSATMAFTESATAGSLIGSGIMLTGVGGLWLLGVRRTPRVED